MAFVTGLYKSMLLERKFGLTTNVMATKMIPSLAPQTVNPALNVDQFTNLMEVQYLFFFIRYYLHKISIPTMYHIWHLHIFQLLSRKRHF